MLIADRKYLFQIIRASDGNRAEPFICSPSDLQETVVSQYDSSQTPQYYVLVLADVSQDIKPQEFVSRFPLYTLESWANLTFNSEETQNG